MDARAPWRDTEGPGLAAVPAPGWMVLATLLLRPRTGRWGQPMGPPGLWAACPEQALLFCLREADPLVARGGQPRGLLKNVSLVGLIPASSAWGQPRGTQRLLTPPCPGPPAGFTLLMSPGPCHITVTWSWPLEVLLGPSSLLRCPGPCSLVLSLRVPSLAPQPCAQIALSTGQVLRWLQNG